MKILLITGHEDNIKLLKIIYKEFLLRISLAIIQIIELNLQSFFESINSLLILWMIYYDRIDVFKGIDVYKETVSK